MTEAPLPGNEAERLAALQAYEVLDTDPEEAFDDLASLPAPVDAMVLEVPKEETAEWVARAVDAGITNVWIHMGRETPEGLALAKEKGLEARTGNCAVMYVTPGASMHGLHRWIWKRMGKF